MTATRTILLVGLLSGIILGWFSPLAAADAITFDGDLTQFYFANIDGGTQNSDRYGGHGDYVANVDLGALNVHEGLSLKLRAEHRFGETIGRSVGVTLPPTLAAELPVADSRELYLTNVLLTQFLSPSFAIYAGKLDTLDGDANAYAGGRGIRQFSNVGFVANPIALRTIPYASLGGGFVILDDGEPLLNFLVINPTDTTQTDGFSELFADGVAFSTELRFRTDLTARPGHQLLGATYSTRDFVRLGQDPRFLLPDVPIDRGSDSWSLYWNMDQQLAEVAGGPTGGWGMFARAGIADGDTNPLQHFLSFGLGGDSVLRSGDSFGLGYFHSGTSDEIGEVLTTVLGPIGDSQGVEAYHRFALPAGWSITPDAQWLRPARSQFDDAWIVGFRANWNF